jgi:deoxyribodipyrimidine photo-lyase
MLQIVWFKRDLRLSDHAPLAQAATRGPVLPLFVIEPDVFQADDFAQQHWGFIRESLTALRAELQAFRIPLIIRHGEMTAVLAALKNELGDFALLSHEETGNDVTFQRDRRVKAWCHNQSVPWQEFRQHGVIRALTDRNRWASRWDAHMSEPLIEEPTKITSPGQKISSIDDLNAININFREPDKSNRQHGGRSRGVDLLISFLEFRGQHYRSAMSSPLSAADECSRLSAHFAYGTVSIREAAHALWARRSAILAMPAEERPENLLASLKSFESRLHWHCHFIQKLESEPAIEFHNVHRGFDGVRNEGALTPAENAKFSAWSRGETGYPMIDACMKMLRAVGWINFRMRAMLVSFASYQLWLHWRPTSVYLATQFLDYEPGIHYPQVQMQSGVTGINTIRIYNPIKQARDQDPHGIFVRRWLPALARVPNEYIFEPWTMPQTLQEHVGCMVGHDYPQPIVDHLAAAKAARDTLWALRKNAAVRDVAKQVYQKHGSRNPAREGSKGNKSKRKVVPSPTATETQLSLGFDE